MPKDYPRSRLWYVTHSTKYRFCRRHAGPARAYPAPFSPWPLWRQNFSGKGAARENAPASMASRARSKAAGAVAASTPVTNCQILLRPVMTGFPLERNIFARHLPASCSKASTTNPRYSMRPPPQISTVSRYDTGVSGGFRQAGNNVVLSRAVPSVGTLDQRATGQPALAHLPNKEKPA
jgi:hypothetical protein